MTPLQASGSTYKQVLQFIRAWRINNGLAPNDAEVFSFANQVWCKRDPQRCLGGVTPQEPPMNVARRVLTPNDYGRACWGFLATFGVNFTSIVFQMAVNQVRALLNPNNPHNNGSGCVFCAGHFDDFVTAYPPDKVQDAEGAAVWVWLAHDSANLYSGKPNRPSFRTCAVEHGWIILTPEQFESIKIGLAKIPTT